MANWFDTQGAPGSTTNEQARRSGDAEWYRNQGGLAPVSTVPGLPAGAQNDPFGRTPFDPNYGQGTPSGDRLRAQVQDRWGRSPSHPNYGQPPQPGETVPIPSGGYAYAPGGEIGPNGEQRPAPGAGAPGGAPGGGQPVTQEQVMALFQGQPVTPETLKRLQPQLNALGVHLQNEARGDLRPRLLLPNGETVDLGAWGGPPQWQPRGNIGDWHNIDPSVAGGTGGGGGGGSAGMQSALETSPGYQFRLAEGLKGIERGAAAKGTLLTGGTLKALTRYGQDFASNEYQNRYNQLYGLSQLGLNAAGQSGNIGSGYAGQAGNILGGQAQTGTGLITGGANAGAAGTIGAANATQAGLQGAGNAAQQAYWLWLLQQGQRPPGAPGTSGTSGTPTQY